jgi:hypothetical protein
MRTFSGPAYLSITRRSNVLRPGAGGSSGGGTGGGTTPPPSGQPTWKNAASGIAEVDALTLLWQDLWGTAHEPTAGKQGTRGSAPAVDRMWLGGTGGATDDSMVGYFRSYWDAGSTSEGVVGQRMSFADYAGRRCIRDRWPAGIWTSGNLMEHKRNNILAGGNVYLEAACGIDLYVASPVRMWDLANQRSGSAPYQADGKTLFGITVAMRDYEIAGGIGDNESKTNAKPATEQSGCSCGVNWAWRKFSSTDSGGGGGNITLRTYIHHVGVGTSLRDGGTGNYGELMSASATIGLDRWNRLTMAVKLDPSARSKDRCRFWLDSGDGPQLIGNHVDVDLGGWQGNRGITGTGRIAGSSGGGWGVAGFTSHSMMGGPTPMPLDTEANFYWSNAWWRVGARKP